MSITVNDSSERKVEATNGKMNGKFHEYTGDDGLRRKTPINVTGGGYSGGLFMDLYLNEWSTQLELIPHAPEATYGEMPRISYATRTKEEMFEFLTNLRDALTTAIEMNEVI